MARIRSIKPEFWTSENVVECSPNARLLFIGLWSFADDSGIHPASTKRLKMEVFPGDPFTDQQVSALIDELLAVGLLKLYEVSSEPYWLVTGWKHQKIDQPTFRHPLPNGDVPRTPNKRRPDAEPSPNTSRVNVVSTVQEGRGGDVDVDVESKGRGQKTPPSKYVQSDFDERDWRFIAQAKRKIDERIQARVGCGDTITDDEYWQAVAEESGVPVKRVVKLNKTMMTMAPSGAA